MSTGATRRRKARVALLQALMPASIGSIDVEATQVWLRSRGMLIDIDKRHFKACLGGIADSLDELDQCYLPFMQDRELAELGQVEKTILRIATFELTKLDVPFKVVLNEWVAIAKDFGATGSFKFINGVLDRVAKNIKPQLPAD